MKEKQIVITVKDHSVSGESFQLIYNSEFDMLETHPQPNSKKLADYYKTEDYISHTNSKRNWLEKAYHIVREISLKKKLKLINSFRFEEKRLLDIGCGTGDFLQKASQDQWNVHGIEPNEKARALANKKVSDKVFSTEQLLKFEPHSFDVISLWHVLEHLPELEEQIAIYKMLLKPGGRIIIAVPNYNSYDAGFYKEFWAAYDTPRHLWHFSQTSIRKLFGSKKMQVEKIVPMKFDAYYISLLSEKYKSGWMNIFRAFFVGTLSNMKAASSKEYASLIYILKNA